MIAGFVKGFGVDFEYALHGISYANMVLMGATLPSYGGKKEEKDKNGNDIIRADDPKNKDLVKAVIKGYKI